MKLKVLFTIVITMFCLPLVIKLHSQEDSPETAKETDPELVHDDMMTEEPEEDLMEAPLDNLEDDYYKSLLLGPGALPNYRQATNNTAIGYYAMHANTYGSYNTALGTQALYNNTEGYYNSALGYWALYSNVTGKRNTAVGNFALQNNDTGNRNTAVGVGALLLNTSGSYNIGIGNKALASNTTGRWNTAVGFKALASNTGPTSVLSVRGCYNVAVGTEALSENTLGHYNVAIGDYALKENNKGAYNTGVGHGSLRKNTGSSNTAFGSNALQDNTTGTFNVAVGVSALKQNTTGQSNVAVGIRALSGLMSGESNIAIGNNAGKNLTTGNENIYIGNVGQDSESNVIRIGSHYHTPSQPSQNVTYIAGISGVSVTGGSPVYVAADGQLGVNTSSMRFKEDIESLNSTDDRILELRPVSFRYKQTEENKAQPVQYGLIAEEVAEIMPELVQLDEEGKPFTVKYQFLAPMLLDMVQRDHKEIEEQKVLLESLKAQNDALRQELVALRHQIITNKVR